MAHKKAGGSTKNLRDSKPKYLGVKVNHGAQAQVGSILVRQRGTEYIPGRNVDMGKDHTIYSVKVGTVEFKDKRKQNFDGSTSSRKMVSVK